MGIKSFFGKFGKKSDSTSPSPDRKYLRDQPSDFSEEPPAPPTPEDPVPAPPPSVDFSPSPSILPDKLPPPTTPATPIAPASPALADSVQESEEPTGKDEDGRFDVTPGEAPPPTGAVRSDTSLAQTPAEPSKPSINDMDFRASQTFRVMPPPRVPDADGDALSDSETVDELRSSQTIRVGKPSPVSPPSSPPLPPSNVSAPDQADIRRSQTFKVLRPEDGNALGESKPVAPVTGLPKLKLSVSGEANAKTTSQTFKVLPPKGKDTPASLPAVASPTAASQTFPPPSPVGVSPAEGSQTFKVPSPSPAALEDEGEGGVELPIEALLRNVPEELQGPSWEPESVVGEYVLFDAEMLVEQLRQGDVRLRAGDLAEILPDGWLTGSADAPISLALDLVVASMPQELLLTSSTMDSETAAASTGPDLFRTSEPPPPVPEDVSSPTFLPPTPASPAPSAAKEPVPAKEPPARTQHAVSGETISLPCSLLLAALPAEARGAEWNEETFPETLIPLPGEELLQQLGTGRIVLDTARFRSLLPQGWLGDTDIKCELPLNEVVMAIPPELLRSSAKENSDVAEVEKMPGFFTADIVPPDAPDQVGEPLSKTTAAVAQPEKDDEVAEEIINVSMRALLGGLPLSKRGEQWVQDAFPDDVLSLPRTELLSKLREGRVPWDVERLRDQIPPGWLAEPPLGEVELSLAELVASIPLELMGSAQELGEDAQAASEMPQLFHSDTAKPAEVAPAAVEPEKSKPASPVSADLSDKGPVSIDKAVGDEKLSAKKELALASCPEWDGVESSLEMAPRGVDINLADARELTSLPGIGQARAESLIAYRNEHGLFQNVFDLGGVPGIGPSLFRRMTGLALRRRVDRHMVLVDLLGLANEGQALLVQVAACMHREVGALGCVITTADGIPLAASGELKKGEGRRVTALGARFFSKTRRHLQRFIGQDSDCIMLPGCTPPLMLVSAEDVVLIFLLRTSQISKRRLLKVRRATREIGWLLSRRATVINY